MLRALARHGTLVTQGFTGGREVVLDVLDLIGGDKKIAGYGIHADSDANISKALTELVDLARRGSLKPKIDTVVPLEEYEKGYSRLTSIKAVGSIVVRL